MKRRTVVSSALALTACGGGGWVPATVTKILAAGDSVQSGQLATEPGAPVEFLPVRPAARLHELLGPDVMVLDGAQAGALAFDGLMGLPRQLAGQGISIAVLRYGAADAVVGTPLDVLCNAYVAMVDLCSRAGVTPVLVGMPHSAAFESALSEVNDMAQRVAAAMRVPFADTWAVPPGGILKGHPDQAYSAALCVPIADAVRPLL